MKSFLITFGCILYVCILVYLQTSNSFNTFTRLAAIMCLICFFSKGLHFIANYEPKAESKKYLYTNQGKVEIED